MSRYTTREAVCRHATTACSHLSKARHLCQLCKKQVINGSILWVHLIAQHASAMNSCSDSFPHGLQVASYAFTFPDEDKNDTQIRIMLPLFDLLNHGNPGASQHFALSLHILQSNTVLELRSCTVQD